MLHKKKLQLERETNLVKILLAMELLAPPILEFIFKQSCAIVISLHIIAFFAWMHWVARPVFLSICRTLSSFISKFPFSVSQILLRWATKKNRTLITSRLYLQRVFVDLIKNGVYFGNTNPEVFQYASKSLS